MEFTIFIKHPNGNTKTKLKTDKFFFLSLGKPHLFKLQLFDLKKIESMQINGFLHL